MSQAACVCHTPLDRLGFKGTLDTARHYSRTIAQVTISHRKVRQALYADMLSVIAQDQVPEKSDRFEARCQKRRPKPCPFMTRHRRELKAARKRLERGVYAASAW
jgi:hypothetical protein